MLHDAFVQFTVARPELSSIRNLDNYLFGVLRILRVSQLRRDARQRLTQLSLIEYDSAQLGLRMLERASDVMQIQDELRHICRYACARKETSKAGSVLILRFFHGYYPSEIAAILRSSRKVADMRLQAARREARAYCAAPERLRFINAATPTKPTGATMTTQTADDLLLELRNEIFSARTGSCSAPAELQRMYQRDDADAVSHERLSHIVSCATCLDAVNQILGLPTLAERHPNDVLDKDTRGPNNGNGTNGGTGGGADAIKRQSQQRAREVFEHRPQELYVAVNGFILGSQRIHAEINEQTLELRESDLHEPPSFIEVFSEQGLRLLLMPIDPPRAGSGDDRQTLRVALSDGRALELNLQHHAAQPTLSIVYCDPLMKAEDSVEPSRLVVPALAGSARGNSFRLKPVLRTVSRLRDFFAAHPLWQPGVVAAALGLLLAAVLVPLVWRSPVAPVSAAELLQKSIIAETQRAEARGQATHRSFTLEERDVASGRIVATHRVEAWQSADQGVAARRLYDAQNRVIAGEWKGADGSSKFYTREAVRAASTANTARKSALPLVHSFDEWRTALAPQSFADLVQTATATLEERTDAYVLSYQFPSSNTNERLLRASLTLRKPDLRAIEQRVVFRSANDEGQLREYRAVENQFEQLPADKVPASVFQPDAELIAANERVSEAAPKSTNAPAVQLAAPIVAGSVDLAALEIEARYLLDRVNANLGEQVSFARAGGRLRITALVETDRRKTELLTALAPMRTNPAAAFDIATYAEAAQREPRTNGAVIVSEFAATQNQIPAAADLRRYFALQTARQSPAPADEWLEDRIAEFAQRIQAQAMKPLRHARALRTLVEQIAPAELERLAPVAKAQWQSMLQAHALAVARETATLRAELQPVFFTATAQGSPTPPDANLNLRQAVARLVALAADHDAVVGQAFSKSATNASAASLKSDQFRQSLLEAEAIARKISQQQ